MRTGRFHTVSATIAGLAQSMRDPAVPSGAGRFAKRGKPLECAAISPSLWVFRDDQALQMT
jgi:hypothetical protein